MNGHAILSPSASGRWIQCQASVRMSRNRPDDPSVYAQEGTDFHTLCEIVASHRLLGNGPDYEERYLEWALETEDAWRDEQLENVEKWIALLQEYLSEEEGAELYLEVRVDTGIPGCWGTADAVIVYPSGRLRVIDIKYGAGVQVTAIGNSQARLYGAGALRTLVKDSLTISEITNTIWQPRMNNLSEETLTRSELIKWRDNLMPIAELALSEDAPFNPSEDACRFCPVAGECAPRARFMLAQDFGDPDILTGEEMADAYSRTSALKKWIADIEDAALKRAYEEAGSVPGYKVVLSGGRRTILDEKKAINRLVDEGYEPDEVSRQKIATLGDLDKVVGATTLQEILGDLLVKSEGRTSLAPESDPRPEADALHSAKTDFAGIDD